MANVPIALQLYSLRHVAPSDPAGSLAQVAEMGYQGVEIHELWGLSPADVRKMLDDNGLQVAGAHFGLADLLGDGFERNVEAHAVLGNTRLIVAGLDEEYRNSLAGWKRAADRLNELTEKLSGYGMQTGYHNHWPEFELLEGQVPWQVLADNTRPEVILQLDTGHCVRGGGDPLAWLQRYPGRGGTVHLKAYSPTEEYNVVIGEDDTDWVGILAACATTVGAKWCIVEQEVYPYGIMDSVRRDLDFLRSLEQ